MLWAVLGVVAAVVVVDLLIRALSLNSILPILERSPPFNVEPTPPAPDAEPISFQTSDFLTLRGSLRFPSDGPSVGLIIFFPELGGDHWSAGWYCQTLLKAGFAILAFDFRNQGESDRLPGYTPLHWLTEYEVTDALTAIEFARKRPELANLPCGLFGISRGGSAALVAAARRPDICAVACEGVFAIRSMSLHYTLRWATLYYPPWMMRLFPIWHIRSTLALARLVSQIRRHCRYTLLEEWLPRLAGRPVLMIVDGRDTYVLPEISEALFAHFPESNTQRWVAKGAKHNMARETDPVEFDRRIVDFFSQAVGSVRRAPVPAPHAVKPASGIWNGRVSS